MNHNIVATELPKFSQFNAEDAAEKFTAKIDASYKQIIQLLAQTTDYRWDNTLTIIESLEDDINKSWAIIRHLHAVSDNLKLREAYNTCLSKLSDYNTEMSQNESLYQAYLAIKKCSDYNKLSLAQQKTICNTLRDFQLSGVALNKEKKQRYKEIQQSLSTLETQFEENVLDATHAWNKHITDDQLLEGLPESTLSLAAHMAQKANLPGWLLTLDSPCYSPVMQYSQNSTLRAEIYRAYVTRAAANFPAGKQWDNTENIKKILNLRAQKASLLEFESYAHYSLATKMAKKPKTVHHFLMNLAKRTLPTARTELNELKQFAKKIDGKTELMEWDIPYYTEQLRAKKFSFSKEKLRPFFPLPQVLSGLFKVVEHLYGISITERQDIDTWHETVHFFEIHDKNKHLRGGLYMDLYARSHKQSGAWMDECIVRRKHRQKLQHPVAFLTCNFLPQLEQATALLNHEEILTLFHEFGHALHHLLTKVDCPTVAGINGVAWDGVEFPSQLMEQWCWEPAVLKLLSKNIYTDQPLTDEIIEKLKASKNFQAGLKMLRQLEFALFDFSLHQQYQVNNPIDPHEFIQQIRSQTSLIKILDFNYFENSFTHIFSGGYAAGYYSYKWAEVLSADAYSKFSFDPFNHQVGQAYLDIILEQGGTRDMMELYTEFLGREPDVEALLVQSGIVTVPC